MINKVALTDDELSLIMTSLQSTINSYDNYINQNGKEKLDLVTLQALEDMKALYNKIESEYY